MSKFDILVGNHGCHVLRSKEEGVLPACYQRSVQKPASLMVWGCISAYGMGSLHVLEGTMNAERYLKFLEQHMLPSRRRLFQGRPCVFQQENAKLHAAAITTAWLRSRRVRVLNWPTCSPDLSPIENIWHIIKWKISQRRWLGGHDGQRPMGEFGQDVGGFVNDHRESGPRFNISSERRCFFDSIVSPSLYWAVMTHTRPQGDLPCWPH